MKLNRCYITCIVKCAPPANKPTPEEIQACDSYLREELEALIEAKVYVALGQMAFKALWKHLAFGKSPRPDFKHGERIHLPGTKKKTLILSYHPSQQNTFTGVLTQPMFDQIFEDASRLIEAK
jgi:uracil-DNA glycosylase family 4